MTRRDWIVITIGVLLLAGIFLIAWGLRVPQRTGTSGPAAVSTVLGVVAEQHQIRYEVTGSESPAWIAHAASDAPVLEAVFAPLPWSADYVWTAMQWPVTAAVEVQVGSDGWARCSIAIDGQVVAESLSARPHQVVHCEAPVYSGQRA